MSLKNIAFAFKFQKKHPNTPLHEILISFKTEEILNEKFSFNNVDECSSCDRDTDHVCLCELENYCDFEYIPLSLQFP